MRGTIRMRQALMGQAGEMREGSRENGAGRADRPKRTNWLKRAAALAGGVGVCLGAAALMAGPAAPTREAVATSRHAAARAVFHQQYAAYAQVATAPRQPLTSCAACILTCQDGGLGSMECEAACGLACGLE